MPRPRRVAQSPETVVTLRLPRELHEKLKLEAEAGERGFAAEVRRRLEASLAPGANDPKTRQLLDAIGAMADFFASTPGPVSKMLGYSDSGLGPWYEDLAAFTAFETAVTTLLALLRGLRWPGKPGEIEDLTRPLAAMALNEGLKRVGVGDRIVVASRPGGEEENKP